MSDGDEQNDNQMYDGQSHQMNGNNGSNMRQDHQNYDDEVSD